MLTINGQFLVVLIAFAPSYWSVLRKSDVGGNNIIKEKKGMFLCFCFCDCYFIKVLNKNSLNIHVWYSDLNTWDVERTLERLQSTSLCFLRQCYLLSTSSASLDQTIKHRKLFFYSLIIDYHHYCHLNLKPQPSCGFLSIKNCKSKISVIQNEVF